MSETSNDRREPRRVGAGFTLIELLVVISIIILLTAMAVPALQNFLKGQKLQQSGRILQTAFNSARRAAVTTRATHYLVFFRELQGSPPVPVFGMQVFREGVGYDSQGKHFLLPTVNFVLQRQVANPPVNTRAGSLTGSDVQVFEGTPDQAGAPFVSLRPNVTTTAGEGWIAFRKDGTIEFQNAVDVPPAQNSGRSIYDPNEIFEAVQTGTQADIILTQEGEINKRCFIDITRNTGRVSFRVLRVEETSGTTAPPP